MPLDGWTAFWALTIGIVLVGVLLAAWREIGRVIFALVLGGLFLFWWKRRK